MSVFNGEQFLQDAITSILNQTFSDLELLIVDDGSTDDTSSIINEMCFQDRRIRRLTNGLNIGLVGSLNRGLSGARGEFIARMDADDVALPRRIEKQVEILKADRRVNYVTSQVGITDTAGHFISCGPRPRSERLAHWYLHFFNYVGGHGLGMYRRSSVMEVGSYRYHYWARFCEDYELWTRLVSPGSVFFLPDELLLYRRHAGAIGIQNEVEQITCVIEVARRMQSKLLGRAVSICLARDAYEFWTEPPGSVRAGPKLACHLAQMFQMYIERYGPHYPNGVVETMRDEMPS